MIIFHNIRWKNFLATGNSWNEIALSDTKTTVLIGDSGSGKSTLLDALSFVLFNKPFRDVNKKQIINAVNEKECLVEVEFAILNQKFLVRRGIKPDIFEIYQDGKLLNQEASNRDYQQILEKNILKLNFKSFSQIIVLGAANFTPFMQLKASDRRTIIEELLDLQIFSGINVILKQKVSLVKTQLTEIQNTLQLTEEKIKIHEKNLVNLQKNTVLQIKEHQDKIEILTNNIKILTDRQEILKQKVKELSKISEISGKVNAQVLALKQEEGILKRQLSDNTKQKQFYEENPVCPTCKQSIEVSCCGDLLHELNQQNTQLTQKLTLVETQLLTFTDKRKKIEEVQQKKDAMSQKFYDNQNQLKIFIQRLEDNRNQIERLSKTSLYSEEENKAIEELKNKLKSIAQEKNKQVKQGQLLQLAQSLLKDSGIKAQIIKQYLPVINSYVNKFLNAMNFFVVFEMDENFNEIIKTRGRDEFSYNNFSEGEKQRIDLALLFTWRAIAKTKNSINTNLLVLDEVFDSYLDNTATENVISLINTTLFSDSNIVIISHKDSITDKFAKNIKFVKERGFSRIVT